jgi:hypothetical protein
MVQQFCRSGEREGVKGSVHAAACVIATAMATYNAVAWCFRHETHLAANAIVYLLAVVWEVKQTAHHLQRLQQPRDCGAAAAAPPPDQAPAAA